jgi:hypothetical protein
MKMLLLLTLLFLVCLAGGCYYDKEEVLYPTQPATNCDTTAASTYAAIVVPVITGNCSFVGCHNTGFAAGGVILDNYNGVKAQVNNGDLVKSIDHAPGVSPMPKGAAKLSACDIAKIKRWIRGGALNN